MVICFNESERNYNAFEKGIAEANLIGVARMPRFWKYFEPYEIANIKTRQLLDNWTRL